MLLEVCIDRVESAVNAERGGAGRVEVGDQSYLNGQLCDNLVDGGTTPSYGMISWFRVSA